MYSSLSELQVALAERAAAAEWLRPMRYVIAKQAAEEAAAEEEEAQTAAAAAAAEAIGEAVADAVVEAAAEAVAEEVAREQVAAALEEAETLADAAERHDNDSGLPVGDILTAASLMSAVQGADESLATDPRTAALLARNELRCLTAARDAAMSLVPRHETPLATRRTFVLRSPDGLHGFLQQLQAVAAA